MKNSQNALYDIRNNSLSFSSDEKSKNNSFILKIILVKILFTFLPIIYPFSSDFVKHLSLHPPIRIKDLLFIGTINIDGILGQKL